MNAKMMIYPRETVPSLTSDLGGKTVTVLAHKFLLPQRANSGYILSTYPLKSVCYGMFCPLGMTE